MAHCPALLRGDTDVNPGDGTEALLGGKAEKPLTLAAPEVEVRDDAGIGPAVKQMSCQFLVMISQCLRNSCCDN